MKPALQQSYSLKHWMEDSSTASMFTTEMYVIKSAVEELIEINSEPDNYTIFLDFQGALQALKSNMHNLCPR